MARRGGFGASLNPLGTGSLSNFGQYSIGDDLSALARYEAEVKWSNGQLSDADYLTTLAEAVGAATDGSREKISAQNKLDDARYRIGRSDAQDAGPDALIAYDQAALATMNPDNLRYSDVKQALDSELAGRRSRDYGALVDSFQAGTTTTAQLSAWVKATLAGLPPDAPDRDNWLGVSDELLRRSQDEADSKAYQDYQMGRMKPDAFLGYLTARRDAYTPFTPQFEDWSRRVEDATKQVAAAKLAGEDATFFNLYNAGKKSDVDYLRYLRARIDGMPADDPSRKEWENRYVTAAHSLAEDKLRFDVTHGKKPIGALISFYEAYRRTLNPGSAEWRSTTDRLDAAKKWKAPGSGGGGTGTGSDYNKYDPRKAVDPKANLDTVVHQLTITPNSSDAAVRNYGLNIDELENAYKRGDRVWLFHDPANPGAVTQARDSQGDPVVDKNGKPVMVRGAFYYGVTDEAYAKLLGVKVDYENAIAEAALAKGLMGGSKGYYAHADKATEAQDKLRGASIHASVRRLETDLEAEQRKIEHFRTIGDKAGFLNAVASATAMYDAILSDPLLDESKRNSLTTKAEKMWDDPLIPRKDPQTGQPLPGAIDPMASTRDAGGRWIDVALAPGWHDEFHISPTTGERVIRQGFEPVQGLWESKHVTVSTRYGERVVTADAATENGPFTGQLLVHTPDGDRYYRVPAGAGTITWFDDEGVHTAYSFDSRAWITSDAGGIPTAELNATIAREKKDADGSSVWLDGEGNEILKTFPDGTAKVADMGSVGWLGQGAVEERLGRGWTRDPRLRGEMTMAAREPGGLVGSASQGLSVGGDGQRMTLAFLGPAGLNLIPSHALTPLQMAADTEKRFAAERARDFRTEERGGTSRKTKLAYPLVTMDQSPRLAFERSDAIRAAQLNAQLPANVGQTAQGSGLGYALVPPTRLPAYSGVYSILPATYKSPAPPPLPKTPAALPPPKPASYYVPLAEAKLETKPAAPPPPPKAVTPATRPRAI